MAELFKSIVCLKKEKQKQRKKKKKTNSQYLEVIPKVLSSLQKTFSIAATEKKKKKKSSSSLLFRLRIQVYIEKL